MIIPVIAVVFSVLIGIVVMNIFYLLSMIMILVIIDILIFQLVYRTFDRERIITSV